MKLYVKIVLLAIIGMAHSASMCMLQVQKFPRKDKSTQGALNVGSVLQKNSPKSDLSRLPLNGDIEENCFTQLPKDVRGRLYAELKPSDFKSPFLISSPYMSEKPVVRDRIEIYRKSLWLKPRIMLSSTCTSCRLLMMHEDQELLAYFDQVRTAQFFGTICPKKPVPQVWSLQQFFGTICPKELVPEGWWFQQ